MIKTILRPVLLVLSLTLAQMAFFANPIQAEVEDEVLFSPEQSQQIVQRLVRVADLAQTTLDVAIFGFTDLDVANALVMAKKRGVKVRVYRDKTQESGKAQHVITNILEKAGIEVKIKETSALMHMKLMISDSVRYATGSYNWSAGAKGQDNDLYVCWSGCAFVADYQTKFQRMWER